jgi:hypothetical protein
MPHAWLTTERDIYHRIAKEHGVRRMTNRPSHGVEPAAVDATAKTA